MKVHVRLTGIIGVCLMRLFIGLFKLGRFNLNGVAIWNYDRVVIEVIFFYNPVKE